MGSAVLVLEDDLDLCTLLTTVLQSDGLAARGANSGPEAIALATREAFDLIVSDVRMEGMDGLECLAALRKLRPGLRSIVITGYASDSAPARAIQVQADDYLYKPIGLKDFLASVHRVLHAREEQEGYRSVLGSLLRRFRTRLRPETPPDWEALRDLAFQSFYVGVRSRKLSEAEALCVWDDLERLSLSAADPTELATEFRCLIDRVAALARSDYYATRTRRPGQLEAGLFRRLFERIVQGQVSVEQLKLAPYVRAPDPRADLEDFSRSLWG